MQQYHIVPVETTNQKEQFIDLLEKGGLYQAGEGQKRYNWFYQQGQNKAFIMYTNTGVPIGTKGYGIRTFYNNNTPLTGAISVDISVIKEYRQLQQAYLLHKQTAQQMLQEVDFLYGIPNRHSTMLYKRSKLLSPIKPFDRFVKVLSVKEVMGTKLKLLHGTMDFIWSNVNRAAYSSICRSIVGTHFTLTKNLNTNYPATLRGERNAGYLSWRYLQNPLTQYEIYGISNTNNDSAFIVYYKTEGRVYVVDLIYEEGNILSAKQALVGFEKHCVYQKLGAIILCKIGDSTLNNTLRSLWYKQMSPHPTKTLWSSIPIQNDTGLWMLGDEDAN